MNKVQADKIHLRPCNAESIILFGLFIAKTNFKRKESKQKWSTREIAVTT